MKPRRPASPIRILHADDHVLLREGVRMALAGEQRLTMVAQACDGAESVTMAKRLKPDVVLMDVKMPRLNGLEATRRLRRELPDTRVLVLTVHDSPAYVRQLVEAGAAGYLLKDCSPEALVQAILMVHAGGEFFSPGMKPTADSASGSEKLPSGLDELTVREREVLALTGEGLTSKEIAQRLKASPRTIETHRQRIMNKIGVHSATRLVRLAISRGLVKAQP
jgi:DNA-binding NarL/FixJ family response regulator